MKIKDTVISQMNQLGKEEIPFLFILDFLLEKPVLIPLSSVNPKEILYDFNGNTNAVSGILSSKSKIEYTCDPVSFPEYEKQFRAIQQEISYGNTYLLNLTVETPLTINSSLQEIFYNSRALYKLWMKDQWVCFSPETFVKIQDNRVETFPMKGTIDGNIPNAEEVILSDEKEAAEHYTIVDLLRNDLNLVAKKVKVDSFRHINTVHTPKGPLLQVSSHITGELDSDWKEHLGDIFSTILPAGSVSGAPKERTVEIINRVETYSRGYYTGVAGIFDGNSVDTAVLIRFIEKKGDRYVYKSGGGITFSSDVEKEYQEIIQKIYVPTV